MSLESILKVGRHYTPWRRFYPMIVAGYLYTVWVVTSMLGSNNYDESGNIVGVDFFMAYTSGVALSEGAPDELFDYAAQSERQVAILGDSFEGASFSLNLPILQWIYVPFAQLPYLWAVLAWSLFGLALFAVSMKLLGRLSVFPLALTFFPVYANFTFGQNAFVSLVILSSVWTLWSRDKRFLAGLVLALLLYKPQLVTGVGLLWLLNAKRDWPALAGFGVGAAGMAAISFGLMPKAMDDYFVVMRNDIVDLSGVDGFPTFLMHNMRGFFKSLYQPLADPLWLLFAVAGIAVFVMGWRRRPGRHDATVPLNKGFWFAAAVLLTMWTTPHALVYDWTMLLVPAILLWQARPDWRTQLASLYLIGWIAYPLSVLLTKIQRAVEVTVLVQISVLFFAFALYVITTLFLAEPAAPVNETSESVSRVPAAT